MTASFPSRADLATAVTERSTSLVADDVTRHADAIAREVGGRRVLVVGGAGSIGSATVRELARFAPRQLHVVDVDENGLAELVRDLRSQDAVPPGTDLRTTPLDFGGTIMPRLLRDNGGYDLVLNFAALKHVRSEKDIYSLLRMIEVNVIAARRLILHLEELEVGRYFAVSTDKAANPVNIMGATKRAMELVMMDSRLSPIVTSARFANVAFSHGSLLDGWLRRLEKRQPWAVPRGVRRFFVTPEESGQLCLLGAVAAQDRTIVIPALDPGRHLRQLTDVAQDVLSVLGLTPRWCSTESEAREAVAAGRPGEWPVLVTSLDTAGEKDFEEFVGDGDVVSDGDFLRLRTLTTPSARHESLDAFLAAVGHWLSLDDTVVTPDDVIDALRGVVPELQHRRSDKHLDARM